jgi:hypothetical protein
MAGFNQPSRKIGNALVPPIGFGLMGISSFYGAVGSDEERFQVRRVTHPLVFFPHLILVYSVGSRRRLRAGVHTLGHVRRVW